MTAFATPLQVQRQLQGFNKPWYIAGGWAIDLFIGHPTRAHGDIEIALFRQDQLSLRRHLSAWRFFKVAAGQVHPWDEDEALHLPIHELHALAPDGAKLEILLNEHKNGQWQYRRHFSITRPLGAVGGRSAQGLPFLRPEIVLLYKSKQPRPKDEADFANALPHLQAEGRAWLRKALDQHLPGHTWLDSL
ncbi:MAG: hypothetical protein GKR89_06045 [Candidatus Latescibacteria bacterium]|nr:hypothetical protein [Candidatus Latescibacterota bacterium]